MQAAIRRAARAFFRLQAAYDLTIVASHSLVDRLRQAGVTRVMCAPFGVEAEMFDAAERRCDADARKRFLYVGRLDRDKQVDLLLAILLELLDEPGVSVTVAGTGSLRPAFEGLTHPRFRYLGYVRERRAVASLYAQHDVLLAPGAFETFGLAALEAAAAGLVIVGPDQGGTGALLNDLTSPFTFKAGDAAAFLAAARRTLATDWNSASRASRTLAAGYGTWTDAIGRLIAAYERRLERA
jgi:alpha-1,6-mannosyltransferase